MAVKSLKSLILLGLTVSVLTGCEPGAGGGDVTTDPAADTADGTPAVAGARSVKLVDHDVEAPNEFQVTDKALWDGRPSLGGVWVAATNVTDPLRVIMRNPANGKFVIGALFRREADNPGPKLQISSDAADALGLVAGEPATVSVIALRREEAPAPAPDATRPLLDTSESVTATPLADVTATAAAAIAAAPVKPAKPAPANPATPTPATPTAPAASTQTAAAQPAADAPAPASASGSSIQIGIFSVESNANRAVATLAKAGITASVRKETSHGKPLWSVIATGNAAALKKIKAAGFTDAYILKR